MYSPIFLTRIIGYCFKFCVEWSGGKISLSDIEANRDYAFTLLPGRNVCKMGLGSSKLLSMPDLNNYIINDMLSIQCRLTPP